MKSVRSGLKMSATEPSCSWQFDSGTALNPCKIYRESASKSVGLWVWTLGSGQPLACLRSSLCVAEANSLRGSARDARSKEKPTLLVRRWNTLYKQYERPDTQISQYQSFELMCVFYVNGNKSWVCIFFSLKYEYLVHVNIQSLVLSGASFCLMKVSTSLLQVPAHSGGVRLLGLRAEAGGDRWKETSSHFPPSLHPPLPRKRNLSYSKGLQPADIIYLWTKAKSLLKKELLWACPACFYPVSI